MKLESICKVWISLGYEIHRIVSHGFPILIKKIKLNEIETENTIKNTLLQTGILLNKFAKQHLKSKHQLLITSMLYS